MVRGLLVVMACLVVQRGLSGAWASVPGLSSCGAWA